MYSAACIGSFMRDVAMMVGIEFERMRFEEEVIVSFDEERTGILREYVDLIRQAEDFALVPETFGHKADEMWPERKKMFSLLIEDLYTNPLLAARRISDWKEEPPMRGIFLEGYNRFNSTLMKISDALSRTRMLELVRQLGDIRSVLLSFGGLEMAAFVETIVLGLPPEARTIDKPGAKYALPFGFCVEIYELVGKEANFYLLRNPILDGLSEELKTMLRTTIARDMQPIFGPGIDYNVLYEQKMREYRKVYLDEATAKKIPITHDAALAMARETVNWTLGLGSPIENIALDRERVTDIYIDGENVPIYLEHMQWGLCHTPWRYNRKLLEYAFANACYTARLGKKLDERNPLIDAFVVRLNARVHLEGPPATFGEIKGAIRIMRPTPFTYAQYIAMRSMSAFFAGYDDVMVSLGCSEGVMGVKGCGKTSFTAAKIAAIGTRRRIIPVQDIEEIPTKVYRKRGFHIGAAKVTEEEEERAALSLVRITSGLLRMGDAAIIINEMRSKTAIQGVINLLNTQPGVFMLYNFHAESLKDVADRLELVFGMPAASMFATDRYTFQHKYRFARKAQIYRTIRKAYETDLVQRKFVEVFSFERGPTIEQSKLVCKFLRNPEASAWTLEGVDLGKLKGELDVIFIPPALQRRSEDSGVPPEEYIMQAFFKGRMYSQISRDSQKDPSLAEIDFVVKCNSEANRLLSLMEKETGEIDWAELQRAWDDLYAKMLQRELAAKAAQR